MQNVYQYKRSVFYFTSREFKSKPEKTTKMVDLVEYFCTYSSKEDKSNPPSSLSVLCVKYRTICFCVDPAKETRFYVFSSVTFVPERKRDKKREIRKTCWSLYKIVCVSLVSWKYWKMAGLKGLVDTSASCGEVNPLMKLTSHFSQDRGKIDAGFPRQKHGKRSLSWFSNPLTLVVRFPSKMAFFLAGSAVASDSGALEEEFLRFQHRSSAASSVLAQPQTFHLKDLLSELDSTTAATSSSTSKSPL